MPNTIYMFKIGNNGYPVSGKDYQVMRTEQFDGWTDANGREHRSVYRTQMSGSFVMVFETVEQYNAFVADIEANKSSDTSVRCSLFDNYSGQMVVSDYFLTFTPSRQIGGGWEDHIGKLKVSVKER